MVEDDDTYQRYGFKVSHYLLVNTTLLLVISLPIDLDAVMCTSVVRVMMADQCVCDYPTFMNT